MASALKDLPGRPSSGNRFSVRSAHCFSNSVLEFRVELLMLGNPRNIMYLPPPEGRETAWVALLSRNVLSLVEILYPAIAATQPFITSYPTIQRSYPTFTRSYPTIVRRCPTIVRSYPTIVSSHPTIVSSYPTFYKELPKHRKQLPNHL